MDSTFNRLQAACEETGGNVVLNESYSGRGMYGAACIGIFGQQSDCMAVIAQVVSDMTNELFETAVNAVGDEETDAVYDERDIILEMQRALLDFSSDSFGQDRIIYWPGLVAPVVEEDDQLT